MDLFKTLIWDAMIKSALERLFSSVPLLGWGPIGFVVSSLVRNFADVTYGECKKMIQLQTIKLENEAHQKSFDREFIRLKMLERSGVSDREMDYEIAEAQRRLALFVRHT